MKYFDSLLRNLRRPGVTLSQQALKARKEMVAIFPKLSRVQNDDELNTMELQNLAIETLDHAWSVLQLFVILRRNLTWKKN
jgi:hypothetical protein